MFRHLLLPLTGSGLDASAIRHARAIATKSGAELHLMYVLEPPQVAATRPVDAVEWHARRVEAQGYAAHVAEELRAGGLKVEYSVPEGQSSENIIHHAHQGADLMVLPAGVFGRAQVGALGGQVLWRSFVSTLLVRGEQQPPPAQAAAPGPTLRSADRVITPSDEFELATPPPSAAEEPASVAPPPDDAGIYATVLVALDGSKRAECVLPAVHFLGEAFDSRIVLVHVVEEPALPRALPPTPEEIELVRRLTEVNQAAAADYLEGIRGRVGDRAEARVATGRGAASTLHGLVDEYSADLLVMSAHGYGGDQAWPFGEVSTNFIGYGRTPLLLIHDLPWNERTSAPRDVTDEAWGR